MTRKTAVPDALAALRKKFKQGKLTNKRTKKTETATLESDTLNSKDTVPSQPVSDKHSALVECYVCGHTAPFDPLVFEYIGKGRSNPEPVYRCAGKGCLPGSQNYIDNMRGKTRWYKYHLPEEEWNEEERREAKDDAGHRQEDRDPESSVCGHTGDAVRDL